MIRNATGILAISEFAQVLRVVTMAMTGVVACFVIYIIIHYFAKRRYPDSSDSVAMANHVIFSAISYLIFVALAAIEIQEKYANHERLSHVAPLGFIGCVTGLISMRSMLRVQYSQWSERRRRWNESQIKR